MHYRNLLYCRCLKTEEGNPVCPCPKTRDIYQRDVQHLQAEGAAAGTFVRDCRRSGGFGHGAY